MQIQTMQLGGPSRPGQVLKRAGAAGPSGHARSSIANALVPIDGRAGTRPRGDEIVKVSGRSAGFPVRVG